MNDKVTQAQREQWDIESITRRIEQRAAPEHVQQILIKIDALVPRLATRQNIEKRVDELGRKLNKRGVNDAIIWKVARAIEEGRINEASVAGVWPRLETANNPGAYWVAAMKGVFATNGLHWHEERWDEIPIAEQAAAPN